MVETCTKKNTIFQEKNCASEDPRKKNSIETIYCWGLAAILRQKIYLIYPTTHIPNQSPKSKANLDKSQFGLSNLPWMT